VAEADERDDGGSGGGRKDIGGAGVLRAGEGSDAGADGGEEFVTARAEALGHDEGVALRPDGALGAEGTLWRERRANGSAGGHACGEAESKDAQAEMIASVGTFAAESGEPGGEGAVGAGLELDERGDALGASEIVEVSAGEDGLHGGAEVKEAELTQGKEDATGVGEIEGWDCAGTGAGSGGDEGGDDGFEALGATFVVGGDVREGGGGEDGGRAGGAGLVYAVGDSGEPFNVNGFAERGQTSRGGDEHEGLEIGPAGDVGEGVVGEEAGAEGFAEDGGLVGG